jgi:hypothetical protein
MPRTPSGKLDDPAWRRERARIAGLSRTTLDYHVAKVLERAGELSDEDAARIRALLPAPRPQAVEAADAS